MINGVGVLFNNCKDIVISDYKQNKPNRITVTHLSNGKVKISLYSDQGKEEQVLYLCDDFPTDIKGFKVAKVRDDSYPRY